MFRSLGLDEAAQGATLGAGELEEARNVPSNDVPVPLKEEGFKQQNFSSVKEELVAEEEKRYGLRPVAVRRARAAELLHNVVAGRHEANEGRILCSKRSY